MIWPAQRRMYGDNLSCGARETIFSPYFDDGDARGR
jgi:hypothetical protein